jgi:hypothetical protein
VIKEFKLKIDDDYIPFISIEVDDNNDVINKEDLGMYNICISDPEVIDISYLTYVPQKGSSWDGKNFSVKLFKDMNDFVEMSNITTNVNLNKNYKKFAFIKNNILLGQIYQDLNNPNYQMLIAAFSSNPKIVEV